MFQELLVGVSELKWVAPAGCDFEVSRKHGDPEKLERESRDMTTRVTQDGLGGTAVQPICIRSLSSSVEVTPGRCHPPSMHESGI